MSDLDYLAERVPEVRDILDGKPDEIAEDVWFMCKTKTIATALLAVQEYVKGMECCGNCTHYGDRGEDYNCHADELPSFAAGYHPPRVVDPSDACHFPKSRWTRRED